MFHSKAEIAFLKSKLLLGEIRMNYKNANDVFPKELLKEIQKYACGCLVYFPNEKETKSWGSVSGKKEFLRQRNLNIKKEYKNGKTIYELSKKYYLSHYTIKKIIYS